MIYHLKCHTKHLPATDIWIARTLLKCQSYYLNLYLITWSSFSNLKAPCFLPSSENHVFVIETNYAFLISGSSIFLQMKNTVLFWKSHFWFFWCLLSCILNICWTNQMRVFLITTSINIMVLQSYWRKHNASLILHHYFCLHISNIWFAGIDFSVDYHHLKFFSV